MTPTPRFARRARGICAAAPVWLVATGAAAQTPIPAPAPQNPSPMVEHTRRQFAGNSAPDHIDHFHGMYHFLDLYDRLTDDPVVDSCVERTDGSTR